MAASLPKVESVGEFKGFAKLAKRKKDGKFGESIAWDYAIWGEFERNVKASVLGNQMGRDVWKMMAGTVMVGREPAQLEVAVGARQEVGSDLYPDGITADNCLQLPQAPIVGAMPKTAAAKQTALVRLQTSI